MRKTYAKKSFGQNFLVDQNYISKIIYSLDPKPDETIVEIGSGRGALTKEIVERAGKVLAIELDKDLIPILQSEFGKHENFALIQQDALNIDFQNLLTLQSVPRKTKLVANLPYNISTAILQHLIQYRLSFAKMVLMLQREVVERITAEAGIKERGFLSVLIQTFFKTEKLFDVPPNAFRPVPKVWSSVIFLEPKSDRETAIKDEKVFKDLISNSFRHKRKTLQNNLKSPDDSIKTLIEKAGGLSYIFETININPKKRAESLEISDWRNFANFLTEKNQNDGK